MALDTATSPLRFTFARTRAEQHRLHGHAASPFDAQIDALVWKVANLAMEDAKAGTAKARVLLTILSYNRRGLVEGFDGPSAHVAVASVRPLLVVVDQPGIEPSLQIVELVEDGVAHRDAEELVEHGAVEALDETVGLRPAHSRLPVLDIVQRQVELEGVGLGAAELAAVVGEHGSHGDPAFDIERQDLVVQDQGGGLGPLAGVQGGEAVGTEGVDHRLHVDLAEPFEVADVERVLGQQLARPAALDMPLAKGRVGLLDQPDLLRGQLDRLGRHPFLELQQPLVLRADAVLDQDALHGGRADPHTFELQLIRQPHTAPSGIGLG